MTLKKLKPYEGTTKDSGVDWIGEIPEGWRLTRVKQLFNIGRGRVIPVGALVETGKFPVYSSQTKEGGVMGYLNTCDFQGKYITWTTDGANAGTVFIREGRFNCTNVCGTLQAKSNTTLSAFYAYFLQAVTPYYKRPDINGAKIMNGEMAVIEITTPSPSEQQTIADYLDRETLLIDKRKSLYLKKAELLKEYKKSLIHRAVTKGLYGLDPSVKEAPKMVDSGVEWIGEIPEGWRCTDRLKTHFRLGMGATILTEQLVEDGKIPVYSATAQDHYFGFVDETLVILTEGDLVIPARGNSIGFVKLVKSKIATCTQTTIYLRKHSSTINSSFLAYYLKGCKDHIFWFDNTAIPQITVAQISNKPVVTPGLNEQKCIAEYLDNETGAIDKQIRLLEQLAEKQDELKKSLIYEAVTGKVVINES